MILFITKWIEESADKTIRLQNELANLYELSAQFSLTDAGEDKMIELRQSINRSQKELRDAELLFEYAKKLMDANAEVAFLVSEEFESRQISERIHAASGHVTQKLNAAKMSDLDLARAHQTHIEKQQQKQDQQQKLQQQQEQEQQQSDP